MNPMYCEECHRVERDPIMLDTETCGQCGGYLAGMDEDDGDDDRQEAYITHGLREEDLP